MYFISFILITSLSLVFTETTSYTDDIITINWNEWNEFTNFSMSMSNVEKNSYFAFGLSQDTTMVSVIKLFYFYLNPSLEKRFFKEININ